MLKSFAITACTALLLVAGFNLAMERDTQHGMGRAFVKEYVERLRTSDGLVWIPQDRAIKHEMLMTSKADCFVVGSSQTMQIGQANFAPARDCRLLENLSVSGGSLEDFITAAHIIHMRKPRVVFIGVSPWWLRLNADSRWTELSAEHVEASRYFGLAAPTHARSRWADVLNGHHFFRRAAARVKRSSAIVEASQKRGTDGIIKPDGQYLYPDSYLASRHVQAVGRGLYGLSEPVIDPRAASLLEKIIQAFKAAGTAPVLLMIPYHHGVWSQNGRAVGALREVGHFVKHLAARYDLAVIGDFDPRVLGLGPADFLDDIHISESGLLRIR